MCRNGSSKLLFRVEVELLSDTSLKVKEKILKRLKQGDSSLQDLIAGSIKQLRLFNIDGIELHNTDSMSMLKDDDYLYFSFSKDSLDDLNR